MNTKTKTMQVIEAVAGGGKTESLVKSARKHARNGSKVLILTLTNAAKYEAMERLQAFSEERLSVYTVHGLAVKAIMHVAANAVYSITNKEGESLKDALASFRSFGVLNVAHAVEIAKELCRGRALKNGPIFPEYDVCLVDEFQDNSVADMQFLSIAIGAHVECYGDPLQSIYSFRKASATCYNALIDGKYFPLYTWVQSRTIRTLESWRCPPAVGHYLQCFMPDEYKSFNPRGEGNSSFTTLEDGSEAIGVIEGGSTVILARYNEDLREFLFESGAEQMFPDAAQELLEIDPADVSEDATRERVRLRRMASVHACSGKVFEVCTIHASKGREWDQVIYLRGNPLKEYGVCLPRNLEYVAVTRARKALVVV